MSFKVGDRVIAVEDLTFAKRGNVGTIMGFKELDNYFIVKWDKKVNGFSEPKFNIPFGYGEYVASHDINLYPTTYELHIMCKDGITTNCVYKENGKIVNKSSTRRNVKEDEFDFKEAVKNCIKRVGLEETDESSPSVFSLCNKNLVGKRFKAGQRVRIINTKKHNDIKSYTNLDLYIGESGYFECGGEFGMNNYVGSIKFDNPILNKIDVRNGTLRWNWSEVELID